MINNFENGNRNSPVPEAVYLRLSKIATDESVGEDDFVTTNDAPSPQGQIQSGHMLWKLQYSAQSLCTCWCPLTPLLWISLDLGCVAWALHGHLHVAAPQLVSLHHIQLPLVLDLDDLQQLGLPTPGGHSLCPALDSPAGVCRHVLPVELLADVGVNVALEPGLGHLPVHVPVGAAHLAAHDQVISVKAACWPA